MENVLNGYLEDNQEILLKECLNKKNSLSKIQNTNFV